MSQLGNFSGSQLANFLGSQMANRGGASSPQVPRSIVLQFAAVRISDRYGVRFAVADGSRTMTLTATPTQILVSTAFAYGWQVQTPSTGGPALSFSLPGTKNVWTTQFAAGIEGYVPGWYMESPSYQVPSDGWIEFGTYLINTLYVPPIGTVFYGGQQGSALNDYWWSSGTVTVTGYIYQ